MIGAHAQLMGRVAGNVVAQTILRQCVDSLEVQRYGG